MGGGGWVGGEKGYTLHKLVNIMNTLHQLFQIMKDEREKLTSFDDHRQYGTTDNLKSSDTICKVPPNVVISNVDTLKIGTDVLKVELEHTEKEKITRPGNILEIKYDEPLSNFNTCCRLPDPTLH